MPPNKCRRTQTTAGTSPAFCPPPLFPDADATRLKSPSRGRSSRLRAVQTEAPSAAPGIRPVPRRLPPAYTAPQPPRSPVGSRPPSWARARPGERAAARWVPRGRERGGLAVGARRDGRHPAGLRSAPLSASSAVPLPPRPALPSAASAPLRPPLPAGAR